MDEPDGGSYSVEDAASAMYAAPMDANQPFAEHAGGRVAGPMHAVPATARPQHAVAGIAQALHADLTQPGPVGSRAKHADVGQRRRNGGIASDALHARVAIPEDAGALLIGIADDARTGVRCPANAVENACAHDALRKGGFA